MEKSLFDEIKVGPVTLPNRFVRSATWEGMCDEGGHPTSRLASLYGDLVRGGVGLVITGYTVVDPRGKQMVGTMGAFSDSHVRGMRTLTDSVHRQGGVLFSQLVHAGAQTSTRIIGRRPMAPSAVPSPFYSGTPRRMTVDEIGKVVLSFGQAAGRVREAGFDGIQLHGAHGYLINQFLSPLTNRRRDGYGGTLEKRFRFLEEICLSVRREVGDDYPLTIKLSASDNLEGGLGLEDAVWMAQRLEDLGVNAVEVSAGTAGSGEGVPVRKGISGAGKEAYNAPFARIIKEKVGIPVILVGGLRTFAVIDDLLKDGVADMFSMARPFIREPGLINIWKENTGHRATCVSCNKCFRPGMREGGIYCVIDRRKESQESNP